MKFRREMTPDRTPDRRIGQLSRMPALANMRFEERGAVMIANDPGFRLVYAFNYDTDGFRQGRGIQYRFVLGGWFYPLRFQADSPVFQKHAQTLEGVKESLRQEGKYPAQARWYRPNRRASLLRPFA